MSLERADIVTILREELPGLIAEHLPMIRAMISAEVGAETGPSARLEAHVAELRRTISEALSPAVIGRLLEPRSAPGVAPAVVYGPNGHV